MLIPSISLIASLLALVHGRRTVTTPAHPGKPSTATIQPTPSQTTHNSIPPKRPTAYSEFLFYDVFSRVSRGLPSAATRTHRPTRPTTHRPSKPTNTGKPTTKSASNKQQIEVCEHSVDQYHVVLTPTGIIPSVAQAVCASFGWQYAIPPVEDWLKVHWALANCTYLSTGQYAYAGYYTGGCQFVQQGGAALMKLGDDECAAAGDFPILCMDTPVVYTSTTTTSVFFEETEYVKNAKLTPAAPKVIDRSAVASKRAKQLGDIINGYDVCTTSVNGYHMVYDIFTSGDAAQVCSDLGWYLADIQYSNTPDINSLFDQCQPWDIVFHANSYDGLRNGLCHFAYILPWPSVWMIYSNNPVQCSWFEMPVLCQEDPVSVTVSTGTLALSTLTDILTVEEYYPTNTVTVTL